MNIFKIEPVKYASFPDTGAGEWITFSIEEGATLLAENGADFEDLMCCDPDEDPVEEFMALSDYLQEGSKMGDYISSFGLQIEENQITVFRWGPDKFPALDVAERIAASVVDEYEWRIGNPDPRPTWDMFDLSGDDCVDYAGGHVGMAVDFIRAVLKCMEPGT